MRGDIFSYVFNMTFNAKSRKCLYIKSVKYKWKSL